MSRRNSDFLIFPTLVSGNSLTISIRSGHLNCATPRAARNSRIRGESESLTIVKRQIGARPLTENLIGHRNNGGGADGRMRDQVRFDFLSVDLFAAAIDQVFYSSLDDEITGRIEPHEIPGAIEAISSERFAIALGRMEVAANRVRTATPKFANFSARDVGSVGVDDPDLVGGRKWTALRRERHLFGRIEACVAQQSFGHPKHLLHDQMRKGSPQSACRRLLEPLTANCDNAQRSELGVRGRRKVKQSDSDRGNARKMSDFLPRDCTREVGSLGCLSKVRTRADEQRAEQSGACQRKVVLGGKCYQDPRFRRETSRNGGCARVVQIVRVSARYELRHPGSPAGEQEQCDVEWIARPTIQRRATRHKVHASRCIPRPA